MRSSEDAVALDEDHHAQLIDRIEFLEDSLAALEAREQREETVPWAEVREE